MTTPVSLDDRRLRQLLPNQHTTAYVQGIRATIEVMRTSGVEADIWGTPEPQIEKAQSLRVKTEGSLHSLSEAEDNGLHDPLQVPDDSRECAHKGFTRRLAAS
jgi:hypothetical protein